MDEARRKNVQMGKISTQRDEKFSRHMNSVNFIEGEFHWVEIHGSPAAHAALEAGGEVKFLPGEI